MGLCSWICCYCIIGKFNSIAIKKKITSSLSRWKINLLNWKLLTLTERHRLKLSYQEQEVSSYEDSKRNIRFNRYQRSHASLLWWNWIVKANRKKWCGICEGLRLRGLSLLDCEIIECMDSIPYALFLYLISGKMQKSNVTSFLRVVLKKNRKKKSKKSCFWPL